jgi:hypothetical protein
MPFPQNDIRLGSPLRILEFLLVLLCSTKPGVGSVSELSAKFTQRAEGLAPRALAKMIYTRANSSLSKSTSATMHITSTRLILRFINRTNIKNIRVRACCAADIAKV